MEIDIEEERTRLTKKVAELDNEIGQLREMLKKKSLDYAETVGVLKYIEEKRNGKAKSDAPKAT